MVEDVERVGWVFAAFAGAVDGAVLGVAVLGAIVRTRQSGGASFEPGLNSAFVAAGAVTMATAVFTGLWLATSKPADTAAQPLQPNGSPTITTPAEASWNSR